MNFYVLETDAAGVGHDFASWEKTRAKSLSGAKRAAERRRMFQGTALHVAVRDGDDAYRVVAIKRPLGALDMNAPATWQDIGDD